MVFILLLLMNCQSVRDPHASCRASVRGVFPVFFLKLFDGLGDDEGTLAHVVEFPDAFRSKAGVRAVDELLTSKVA